MKRLLFTLLLMLFMITSQATHIVGADISYTCTDPLTYSYTINIDLYRDCQIGQAPFDQVIYLFVFEAATGSLSPVGTVPVQVPATLSYLNYSPNVCIAGTSDICVQQGTYTVSLTLPPISGGYDISWARCCRNATVTNLDNPLVQGVSVTTHIPDPTLASYNTSPVFNMLPLSFFCVNQPFAIDQSATDADGDSLVYALVPAYNSLNYQGYGAGNPQYGGNLPVVDPIANPMGVGPYQPVGYGVGYTYEAPFGGTNANLDPQTGLFTHTPAQTGIYVYAIEVREYRNGILLGSHRRDYQINVINCLTPTDVITITQDIAPLNPIGDTIVVTDQGSFCYDVTVTNLQPGDTLLAFALGDRFGAEASFSYTGTNPLSGQVCWQPDCHLYSGEVFSLIIGASNTGACESIAGTFDTVWVKVISGGQSRPSGPMPVADFSVTHNTNLALFSNQSLHALRNVWYVNVDEVSRENSPLYEVSGRDSILVKLLAENGCGTDSFSQKVLLKTLSVSPEIASWIRVQPNPIADILTLEMEIADRQSLDIQVLNLQGQILKYGTLAPGETRWYCDLSALPGGMYLIRASGEKGTAIKTFVKQ